MSLDSVSDITVEGVVKKNKKLYVLVIQVEWKDGVIIEVYRSYSETLALQEKLLKKEEFLSYLKNEFAENRTGYLLQDKSLFGKLGIKKRKKAMKKMSEVEEFLKSVVHLPSIISTSDDVLEFFRPVPDDMMSLDNNGYESYNMKGPKAMGYALSISEPIPLEQYVAVCDYSKALKNDLNIKAGNIVEVIYMGEHGWWFVDLDGDLGWIPASCLEPRDGGDMIDVMEVFGEGDEEMYIAMSGFNPDADDEVALEVGNIVQVKQKNVDGWWLVRCNGCTGWVPCMYLRELSTSRGSYTRQIERQTAMMTVNNIFAITDRRTTWNPVRPIKHMSTVHKATVRRRHYDNKPEAEEKPSYVNIEFNGPVEKGDSNEEATPSYINVNFSPNGNKNPKKHSRGNKNEPKGPSYMNMDFHEKNEKSSGMRTRRRREEDGDLLEIDFGKMEMSTEKDDTEIKDTEAETKPVNNREPKEIGCEDSLSGDASKIRPLEVLKEEDTETLQNGTSPAQGNKLQSYNMENNSTMQDVQAVDPPRSISVSSGGEDNVFLSIGNYTKDADTEVDLHEGESVEVLEQTEGGWWLVRTKDLSIGWAPSNFLEKITPEELKRRKDLGLESPERTPLRPPKTSRVHKKAKVITTEKKFWSFVGKNGKTATCSIGEGDDVNNSYFSEDVEGTVTVDGSHTDESLSSCDLESGVCTIYKENTKL